jgi:GNAT superfamily N-acetyltransferase
MPLTRHHQAVIRRAVEADAPALGVLHTRVWRDAYRGIIPVSVLDRFRTRARGIRWQVNIRRSRVDGVRNWVVEEDGELRGFLTTGPARDPDVQGLAELWGIYLDVSQWGSGAGARLMALALRDLRARGATGGVLWVLRDNRRARRFYERFGWRPDGARKLLRIGGYPIWEVRYRRDFTRTGFLPVIRRRS